MERPQPASLLPLAMFRFHGAECPAHSSSAWSPNDSVPLLRARGSDVAVQGTAFQGGQEGELGRVAKPCRLLRRGCVAWRERLERLDTVSLRVTGWHLGEEFGLRFTAPEGRTKSFSQGNDDGANEKKSRLPFIKRSTCWALRRARCVRHAWAPCTDCTHDSWSSE